MVRAIACCQLDPPTELASRSASAVYPIAWLSIAPPVLALGDVVQRIQRIIDPSAHPADDTLARFEPAKCPQTIR